MQSLTLNIVQTSFNTVFQDFLGPKITGFFEAQIFPVTFQVPVLLLLRMAIKLTVNLFDTRS